jgi:hypothetical protein
MAVAMNPNYCNKCGILIRERHTDMGKDFCGDTFCGYEPHTCNTTTEQYRKYLADEKKYRNSTTGKKHAAEIKEMMDGFYETVLAKREAKRRAESERTDMDYLNEFLREIADNDKVGIRRKLVAIKRYIANIENGSTDK